MFFQIPTTSAHQSLTTQSPSLSLCPGDHDHYFGLSSTQWHDVNLMDQQLNVDLFRVVTIVTGGGMSFSDNQVLIVFSWFKIFTTTKNIPFYIQNIIRNIAATSSSLATPWSCFSASLLSGNVSCHHWHHDNHHQDHPSNHHEPLPFMIIIITMNIMIATQIMIMIRFRSAPVVHPPGLPGWSRLWSHRASSVQGTLQYRWSSSSSMIRSRLGS